MSFIPPAQKEDGAEGGSNRSLKFNRIMKKQKEHGLQPEKETKLS